MVSLQAVDYAVIRVLNAHAAQSTALDMFIYDIADSSLLQGGAFMALFWWYWFSPPAERDHRRREIVIAFLGGLVAVLASRLLQLSLPFHQRPLHTPDLGFVVPYGVNPLSLSYWNSFPSDHAVLFFAFATAIAYQSRRMGLLAGLWSLVMVCLPRLYLGYHYPSDVAAGAVIGVALMASCHRVLSGTRLGTRLIDRVLTLEARHGTAFYVIAFMATFELGVMFYDVRHLGRDAYAMFKTGEIISADVAASDESATLTTPLALTASVNPGPVNAPCPVASAPLPVRLPTTTIEARPGIMPQ